MAERAPTPVERFFAALAVGDREGAIGVVHDDAVFEAQGPSDVPIYGTFRGKAGVQEFIGILGNMLDTEAFDIFTVLTNGDVVMAHGRLSHRVRTTGKQFACEWALVCRVKDDRIVSYKMFEDTAAPGGCVPVDEVLTGARVPSYRAVALERAGAAQVLCRRARDGGWRAGLSVPRCDFPGERTKRQRFSDVRIQ